MCLLLKICIGLVAIAVSMLIPTSTAKSVDKGEYHYSEDGKFYDAHESRGEHYNEDIGWRKSGVRNLGRSRKAKVDKPRRQLSKLREENEGPFPGIKTRILNYCQSQFYSDRKKYQILHEKNF